MNFSLEHAIFGSAETIGIPDLKKNIAEAGSRPLFVKFGADPTAPDLHFGHLVVIRRLQLLQQMGCSIQFVIGDFTAAIGDPTGRSVTRPPLSRETILKNAATYKEQVLKFLNPSGVHFMFNSEWLGSMQFVDLIHLASKVTLGHMLERQDFKDRRSNQTPIHLHEMLYTLAQAQDSIRLRPDIEVGGMDQRFNFTTTRDLQRAHGQIPECAIMMPILTGLDGKQKMSKSLGNHIGVTEDPDSIFGKVMSIQDSQLWDWNRLLGGLDWKHPIENPMEAKKGLAETLVCGIHGLEASRSARRRFESQVQRKEAPEHIPEIEWDPKFFCSLPGFLALVFGISKSEARRKVEAGAVKIDGEALSDPKSPMPSVKDLMVVQFGKREFRRLRVRG